MKQYTYKQQAMKKIRRYTVETVKAVVMALVFVMALKSSLVEATQIHGASMTPTLLEGDYILVNKFTYGLRLPFIENIAYVWGAPRRGDVVTFLPPKSVAPGNGAMFVKRIVAVAGDRVEMRNARLFINGRAVSARAPESSGHVFTESMDGKEYRVVKMDPYAAFGPVTVPKGYVFAIGDNRDNSYDCRNWGPLPIERIEGKAMFIYFSKTIAASIGNLARIGDLL